MSSSRCCLLQHQIAVQTDMPCKGLLVNGACCRSATRSRVLQVSAVPAGFHPAPLR